MLERYTIRHQAFLQAFNKLDLSTLSPELQEELHQVRQALGNNVNEATIRRLDALVKKSDLPKAAAKLSPQSTLRKRTP